MNDMDAGDRLSDAQRMAARVHRRSRWTVRVYAAIGTAGVIYITICGFEVPNLVFQAAFVLWIGTVCAATIYAKRQPVEPRGYRRRFNRTVAVWFVVWMVVFIVGFAFFRHQPAWWVGGGVVSALIMYGGAYREIREARR
ncbi:MAG TPA: hypothetical protein VGL93_06090 [Streptosporangiaceae bacterium]|jgi:multisubunit Na+/H+ antiporter MnhB subunit